MEQLAFVFDNLPWIKPFFLWVAAGIFLIIAWVIISFPSNLINAFLQKVRRQIENFTRRLCETRQTTMSKSSQPSNSAFDLFYTSHNFYRLDNENRQLWQETVNRIVSPVSELLRIMQTTGNHIRETGAILERSTEQVKAVEPRFSPIPECPSAENLWIELKDVRRAKVLLWIAVIFAAALIGGNTWLLSQILRDVVDIGTMKIIGGLRLYHFLALLLTFIEGATGIGHAHFERQRPTMAYVFVGLAVTFSVVEGFFYSRLGSPEENLTVPILHFTLNMEEIFFTWGFLIPLMLAFMVYLFYEAMMTISDGYTLDQLKLDLKTSCTLADCVFRSIRPPIPKHSGRLFRGFRPGSERSDAGVFSLA